WEEVRYINTCLYLLPSVLHQQLHRLLCTGLNSFSTMTWLSNVLAVALTGSSIVTALPGFNSKRSDVYSSLNRRQYPDPEHDMHYRRTLSSPLIKRDADAVAYNNCSAPVVLSGKAPKENIWGG